MLPREQPLGLWAFLSPFFQSHQHIAFTEPWVNREWSCMSSMATTPTMEFDMKPNYLRQESFDELAVVDEEPEQPMVWTWNDALQKWELTVKPPPSYDPSLSRSEQMWPELNFFSTQYSRNIGFYIPQMATIDAFWTAKAYELGESFYRSVLVLNVALAPGATGIPFEEGIKEIFDWDFMILCPQLPAFGREKDSDYVGNLRFGQLAREYLESHRNSLWFRGFNFICHIDYSGEIYLTGNVSFLSSALKDFIGLPYPAWREKLRDPFVRESLDLLRKGTIENVNVLTTRLFNLAPN